MTAAAPNAAKMRDEIAETMWSSVGADDLPHACDALGMPQLAKARTRGTASADTSAIGCSR